MTFSRYQHFYFKITSISLGSNGTVENFRKVRKLLSTKKSGNRVMLSRMDVMRKLKSRNKRRMFTPQQKWAHKKLQQLCIKNGWGVAIDDI